MTIQDQYGTVSSATRSPLSKVTAVIPQAQNQDLRQCLNIIARQQRQLRRLEDRMRSLELEISRSKS